MSSGYDDFEAFMAADAEAPSRPDRQEFPGTVTSYNLGLNSAGVILDDGGGDMEIPSLVGALTVGMRVMVGFEQPHWCAVTGIITKPVVEPPPEPDVVPWIELVDGGISVSNGSSTSISWDSATAGGGIPAASWWTAGTSIAVPIAGLYMVACYGEWDLDTTGFRQMHIRKNGTIVRIDHREGDNDDGPPQGLAFPIRFAQGDLVRFSCFFFASGGTPATLGIDNLTATIAYMAPAT